MLSLAGLVLQVVSLAAFKFGWSMASARRWPMTAAPSPTPGYGRKGPEGGVTCDGGQNASAI
jgi:hypothetical protein